MTNMMNSKHRVSVFALIALLFFVIGQQAISGNWDRRSSTEADSQATCYDCLRQAAMVNSQYEDFRSLKVAIFSANPDGEWVDPRVEMSLVENPQLRAIGVISVSATLTKAPRGDKISSAATPSSGAGLYEGKGTGFMISECLMLTNHHVVNIGSNESDVSDRKIEVFQRDQNMDGTFGAPKKQLATIAGSGNYQGQENQTSDWSVLKLDQPRQDKSGVIPLCFPSEQQAVLASFQGKVSSASFFEDLQSASDGKLFGQKACHIFGKTDEKRGVWSTDCAAIPGASGSPIFAKNSAGKICALGMLTSVSTKKSSANTPTSFEFNMLIPFSDPTLRETLKNIMDQNKCETTTRT